eukprot:gene4363-7719_t
MKTKVVIFSLYAVAILLRLYFPLDRFSSGIEIVSPVTSSKRLQEGIYYINELKQSPYPFTPIPPLILLLFSKIPSNLTKYFFVLIDIIIGGLFFLLNQKKSKEFETKLHPHLLSLIFLLNPITIATCQQQNLVVFEHLTLILFLIFQDNAILNSLFISFGSYFSIYPIILLISCKSILKSTLFFIFWSFNLFYSSFLVMGSNWDFLNIYLNRLQIIDLTPNYGIFWYFFILVFEQFQFFFLFVFNFHLLVLLIPLYIKFKNDKFLLAFILIASISIFNPYPTFSHSTFYLTIFILFIDSIKKLQSGIYYFFTFLIGMTLGPVLFNTWIYKGTGNANFFYFVTWFYTLCQIRILIEFIKIKN